MAAPYSQLQTPSRELTLRARLATTADTKESGQQVLRGQRDAPVPAAKRNFTIRKNVDPEVEYEVVWHGCGDPCNKDGPGCSVS